MCLKAVPCIHTPLAFESKTLSRFPQKFMRLSPVEMSVDLLCLSGMPMLTAIHTSSDYRTHDPSSGSVAKKQGMNAIKIEIKV